MKTLILTPLLAVLTIGCAMHPGYDAYDRHAYGGQPGWQMQGPPQMGYQQFGPANFEPGPDGHFCPHCKKEMPPMMDKPTHGPDNKGRDDRMDDRGPHRHKGPEGGMDEHGNPPEQQNPEKMKQQEEMREKVMEFVKQFHPEKAKELRKLHEDNPEEFRKAFRELRHEMEKMEKLEKENPERFKEVIHRKDLRAHCFELTKAYRETTDPDKKAEIKKQLRPAVAELFDLREKDKEREVNEMEENLKKAVEIQKERQKNRDVIIDDHMREMLGEPDPMKW